MRLNRLTLWLTMYASWSAIREWLFGRAQRISELFLFITIFISVILGPSRL